MADPSRRSLAHPGRVAAVAAVGLVASLAVALGGRVPGWELEISRQLAAWPDPVVWALWLPMQLGTGWMPTVVAVAIWGATRDRALAVATFAAGTFAWLTSKAVKVVVHRGRPVEYLPTIEVRDHLTTGYGYRSGHSSMAACLAVMVAAAVPRAWRPVVVGTAFAVGLARIVVGVHLFADVVGGWSWGVLVAVGALEALERWRATTMAPTTEVPA